MCVYQSVSIQVVDIIGIAVSETDKHPIETLLVLFHVIVHTYASIRGMNFIVQLGSVANLVTNAPTELNNREERVLQVQAQGRFVIAHTARCRQKGAGEIRR